MISVSEKFIAISARKPAAIGAVILTRMRASSRQDGVAGEAITVATAWTLDSMGDHRCAVGIIPRLLCHGKARSSGYERLLTTNSAISHSSSARFSKPARWLVAR